MIGLIPDRATLIGLIGTALIAFTVGFTAERSIKNGEIATLKLDHETLVAEAEAARTVALERARATEQKAAADIAALTDQYVEDRQHENAVTQRRIADLAAGNERLRVAVEVAANSVGVRDPAASASGSDGQATAALSRATSARLAGRYADYNELVDQLTLCQGVVVTDRRMTEPPSREAP